MYWVEKGYSYIGAPWFIGNSGDEEVNELIGVGNGGFSLRNVLDSIRVLKSNKRTISFKELLIKNKGTNELFVWLRSAKHYLKAYTFKSIHKNQLINEDKMFCLAGKKFRFFKIPEPKTAIAFAFEKQPNKLYKLNNNQLPFGCHAWFREDFPYDGNKQFWSKYIKIK
jgi:hypothetical protein